MAFRPYNAARLASIEPGDTLETIAQRERAQGNPITAADIAKFNWGTDDPEHLQELLRDELGAIERTEPHRFILSPDASGRGTLKIPESFYTPALPVDQKYRLHVRRKTCPRQFIQCAGLPSSSFDFDSSFLRPEAGKDLITAQRIADAYEDAMLFAFGHTDAVGDDDYNKNLSDRRAWAVHTFLTKDPHAWETLYSHPDEDWGVAALQLLLGHLGHDPGDVDGDLGPATKAAMREFLELPPNASVSNDAAFRVALFDAYMNAPGAPTIAADRFCGDGFMGCGEFNLAEATDNRSPDNRRVTVFAFHKDRLPNFPCALGSVAPCRQRVTQDSPRYNPGFSCSFYDTIAEPCSAENEHHSVSLLIRKYPVDSETVNHLLDEYRLGSKCGKLGIARKAMSAGTRDQTFLELTWEHVREHMTLSLVHTVGTGQRVLLSEVPFSQLHEDGHVELEQGDPPPEVVFEGAVDPDAPDDGEDEGDSDEDSAWKQEY